MTDRINHTMRLETGGQDFVGGGSSGLFLCVSAPSVRPKSSSCDGG